MTYIAADTAPCMSFRFSAGLVWLSTSPLVRMIIEVEEIVGVELLETHPQLRVFDGALKALDFGTYYPYNLWSLRCDQAGRAPRPR